MTTPLYLYSQWRVDGLYLFFFLELPPASWMEEMWSWREAMLAKI
jgi:hypothetical protein